MTLEQIIADIRKKIYKPIYFLMGDENYYIDRLTEFILQNVLDESEKAFNEHVYYGKDVTAGDIDNLARRYPMMANHQVIVIKEAQNVKKIEDLEYYARNPLKSTILVINYKYKSLAKNKKLYKEIEKNGLIFESKKLYENQVPEWIVTYLKRKKCTIDPPAALLLTENLGSDLSKIANELDKLVITLPQGQTKITSALIEKNIGISKDFNNFELQKALGKKEILKANRIVNYFGDNQKDNPFILTITSLYSYFTKVLLYYYVTDKSPRNLASVLKINPYFVNDYQVAARNYSAKKVVDVISLLREYDLKAKGVNANQVPPSELLKEMTYRILH
ncbi:MAG: DNA polymerase III subunit delta [Bacteroidales bacterium]|nr:DNA polymerase III subunit delta [Bacteroidales bacterium]MCF8458591.1 DNA polymerase III subunit delta [Bacteroidales bacterium]